MSVPSSDSEFVTRADAPATRRRAPTIPAAMALSDDLARAYRASPAT